MKTLGVDRGVDWREEYGGLTGLVKAAGDSDFAQDPRPLAKFDSRALPKTKEESDRLMADMFSEALGGRVEPKQRYA